MKQVSTGSYYKNDYNNFSNQKKERLLKKTYLARLLVFIQDTGNFLSFKNKDNQLKEFRKEELEKYFKNFQKNKIYKIAQNPSNNWEILDVKETKYESFNQIEEIKKNRRRFK